MIETCFHRDIGTVCKPWGELNWRTSLALRHVVDDALIPGSTLIIDLTHVPFVDAVGLSDLAGCLRRARTIGATISLRHARPHVQRRIDLVLVSDLPHLPPPITGNVVA